MANFCSECGAALTGSKRFCPECGAAMAPPALDGQLTTAEPKDGSPASSPHETLASQSDGTVSDVTGDQLRALARHLDPETRRFCA